MLKLYMPTLFALSLLAQVATMNAEIVEVTTEEEFQELTNGDKPVIVKFAAGWCPACRGIEETFKKLADDAEFANVTFAHVDIDTLGELAQEHGIDGIPTFIVFKNGAKVDQKTGGSEDTLRQFIRTKAGSEKTEVDAHQTDIEKGAEHIAAHVQGEAHPAIPAHDQHTESAGIFAKIKALLLWIVTKIKDLFVAIIDTIKGFFGRK